MQVQLNHPLEDLVAEAIDELAMRKRVYPKRVREDTMTPAEMNLKISRQEDIIALLKSFQQPSLFELEESAQ